MIFKLTTNAQEDLDYWRKYNPYVVKKINNLIKATLENPFDGIGKPEPLRFDYSGYWSRRITQKDRMIYRVDDDVIIITQLRHHY